jgi:hypothetical protein
MASFVGSRQLDIGEAPLRRLGLQTSLSRSATGLMRGIERSRFDGSKTQCPLGIWSVEIASSSGVTSSKSSSSRGMDPCMPNLGRGNHLLPLCGPRNQCRARYRMESTNVSVHVTRLELVIRLLRDAPVGGMKWLREPRRVEGSGGGGTCQL